MERRGPLLRVYKGLEGNADLRNAMYEFGWELEGDGMQPFLLVLFVHGYRFIKARMFM